MSKRFRMPEPEFEQIFRIMVYAARAIEQGTLRRSPNKHELWPKFISVDGMELARIFDKWKGRGPRTSYKTRDYFDDAM